MFAGWLPTRGQFFLFIDTQLEAILKYLQGGLRWRYTPLLGTNFRLRTKDGDEGEGALRGSPFAGTHR
jgi:hypothetical protein